MISIIMRHWCIILINNIKEVLRMRVYYCGGGGSGAGIKTPDKEKKNNVKK